MHKHSALKLLKALVMVPSILILYACDPYPSDQEKFKALIESWQLEKLSPQVAGSLLKEKGFEIYRHNPEEHRIDKRNYILGEQSVTTKILCKTVWRVWLMFEDEKISNVSTSASTSCS